MKCSSEYVIIQMVTIQPGKPSAEGSSFPCSYRSHFFSIFHFRRSILLTLLFIRSPISKHLRCQNLSCRSVCLFLSLSSVSVYRRSGTRPSRSSMSSSKVGSSPDPPLHQTDRHTQKELLSLGPGGGNPWPLDQGFPASVPFFLLLLV